MRFASVQDLVVVVTMVLTGLGVVATPLSMPCRYLFKLTFNAVLPLPNRS